MNLITSATSFSTGLLGLNNISTQLNKKKCNVISFYQLNVFYFGMNYELFGII